MGYINIRYLIFYYKGKLGHAQGKELKNPDITPKNEKEARGRLWGKKKKNKYSKK